MPTGSEAAEQPLYEKIAGELLAGMREGRFPVGSMLPTEAELSSSYGCSRQTVRAAMRRLLELGAISRRAGSGTRVEARADTGGHFAQHLAALDDLVQLAAGTSREIRAIDTVTLDKRQASRFGAKVGSRWLRLSYIRRPGRANGEPLGWWDVYVAERFAGARDELVRTKRLYSDVLEERYGAVVAEVRQEVTAEALTAERAADLLADPGAPALRVVRWYLDQKGDVIEIVEAWQPGARSSITATLRRVKTRETDPRK